MVNTEREGGVYKLDRRLDSGRWGKLVVAEVWLILCWYSGEGRLVWKCAVMKEEGWYKLDKRLDSGDATVGRKGKEGRLYTGEGWLMVGKVVVAAGLLWLEKEERGSYWLLR